MLMTAKADAVEATAVLFAILLVTAVSVVLGLWLVCAPFVFGYAVLTAPLCSDVVCGLLVAALATVRVLHPQGWVGLSWTVAGIGAWVAVAPIVLAYGIHPGATTTVANSGLWNDALVGIGLVGLGVLGGIGGRAPVRPA